MKKYLSGICISLLFTFNLNSQVIQRQSWFDGDPIFTNFSESQNVIIDSTIRLNATHETKVLDSLQIILYGENARWPVEQFPIEEVYDIDYINEMGNRFYLVTDARSREVFEVNNIDSIFIGPVWSFKGQTEYLVKPVDASIFYQEGDRKILITDMGGNRVIIVDRYAGNEEWAYGKSDEPGIGKNQLSGPSDAVAIPDTNLILIADQGNNRVILVNPADTSIVWSYGEIDQLNPQDIEYEKATNSVLITDQGKDSLGNDNHRVFLISMTNDSIIWQFGTGKLGNSDTTLNTPTDADILYDGNILICDAGNNRLIEVTRDDEKIWSFDHRPLLGLRDADRLPDNRTIVVTKPLQQEIHIPIWLAFSDFIDKSDVYSMGRRVNIDSIIWEGETPPGTSVKLQFQTSNDPDELDEKSWFGPTDSDSFFVNPATAITHANYQDISYYKFQVFLETSNVLNTPILNEVRIRYTYYDENESGSITSEVIKAPTGMLISEWEKLSFQTMIHSKARSVKISIIDSSTGLSLYDFYAQDIDTMANSFELTALDSLKGKQAVRLKATLTSDPENTAYTPILDNWRIDWKSSYITTSQINFVDADNQPVSYYQISPPGETQIDQVSIILYDYNLAAIQDAITLPIQALDSGDVMDVTLKKNQEGLFVLEPSVQAIIYDVEIPNNATLEVSDRDTLIVSYTDPSTPDDTSSDSVLIVQSTDGNLEIVNTPRGTAIDMASIGDSIYVDVTDEADQNTTAGRDTLWIEVEDTKTFDSELLPLVELADSCNNYKTGNFTSAYGLLLTENPLGTANDRLIQTQGGNQIVAIYEDNITLQDFIVVRGTSEIPEDSTKAENVGALHFEVAPNPIDVNQHSALKLRVASSFGTLTLSRIEIYDLAGHRVRKFSSNQLPVNLTQTIPINSFVYSDYWWDLKNDNNDPVSSGTYWIKMYGSLFTDDGENSDQLTAIQKVIIIR